MRFRSASGVLSFPSSYPSQGPTRPTYVCPVCHGGVGSGSRPRPVTDEMDRAGDLPRREIQSQLTPSRPRPIGTTYVAPIGRRMLRLGERGLRSGKSQVIRAMRFTLKVWVSQSSFERPIRRTYVRSVCRGGVASGFQPQPEADETELAGDLPRMEIQSHPMPTRPRPIGATYVHSVGRAAFGGRFSNTHRSEGIGGIYASFTIVTRILPLGCLSSAAMPLQGGLCIRRGSGVCPRFSVQAGQKAVRPGILSLCRTRS